MKKLLTLLLTTLLMQTMFAQNNLEISGYAGYQTNSHINGYNGRFRQIGGDIYGGAISYPINEHIRIKLGYSRMTSFIEFDSYYPGLYKSWATEAFQEFYSIGTENHFN